MNIKVEGEWATVEATAVDIQTGEYTVGEGTIVLLRKTNGEWEAAYPGTGRYKEWLKEVPETLVPSDLKIFLE